MNAREYTLLDVIEFESAREKQKVRITRTEELELQSDWISKNTLTIIPISGYCPRNPKTPIPSVRRQCAEVEYIRPKCTNCPWLKSLSTTAKSNKCRACAEETVMTILEMWS